MKHFFKFLFFILLNIVFSMGIGLNITILTKSNALGHVIAAFLIFIVSLFICRDSYPNGFSSETEKDDKDE